MTTEVAKTENLNKEMAEIHARGQAMAVSMKESGIDASSIEIPKLMLMQNTSGYVSEEKAKLGDVINTLTMVVVGGVGVPFEIVPLKAFKTIRTYAIVPGGQPKFLRVEDYNQENANLPWEDSEAGQPIKRVHCLNFFVLLKKEMEELEAFPAVLTFKSTSMLAGKQLATHIFKMIALNQEPYSKSVMLSVRKEKKDTNTWGVLEVGKGHVLSPEHKAMAKDWLARLASLTIKIHEGNDDSDTGGSGPVVQPVFEPKEPSEHSLY